MSHVHIATDKLSVEKAMLILQHDPADRHPVRV